MKLLSFPKEDVTSYFQPIISLQNQKIIGYESLGRQVVNKKVKSLGPYFSDQSVPDQEHLVVDQLLRKQSIAYVSTVMEKPLLFINTKPSWITSEYNKEKVPFTIQLLQEYQISPSRVVIEITEDSIKDNTEDFLKAIHYYRRQGCLIAVDDVGSGFSNFDRIALVQPDIIKVDLRIIKLSRKNVGYLSLLRSFSILATQVGASLLIEGAETSKDLQHCLSVGARYVQGFLFSEAKSNFQVEDCYSNKIQAEINLYTEQQFGHFEQFYSIEDQLHKTFNQLTLKVNNPDSADRLLVELAATIPDNCLRLYICNEKGTQISSNYTRGIGSEWVLNEQMQGANWCWRPHFIPNILRMKKRKQGIASHIYTDLESNKTIQTFSYPIDDNLFLFLDITI